MVVQTWSTTLPNINEKQSFKILGRNEWKKPYNKVYTHLGFTNLYPEFINNNPGMKNKFSRNFCHKSPLEEYSSSLIPTEAIKG